MARPKLRLPIGFILIPAGFCGMFAIIAGGVAVSQGPNADWTIFASLLGGIAACAAVYYSGRFEWVSEKTLMDMADVERADETQRKIEALVEAAHDGTLEKKLRFERLLNLAWIALVFVLVFFEYFISDALTTDGGSGMAILGQTLGTWRIGGRGWSGVELLFIAGCLAALYALLRKGIDRLARLQNR